MTSLPGVPLVSVILPTHNRPATLKRAIHSVLAQLHGDLELIVVDDASDQGTHAAAATFKDPRLHYVRLDSNRGAGGARNEGLRRARGTLIAYQDDDDVWLIDKLQKQVAFLSSRPDIGLCLTGYYRVSPGVTTYVRMRPHSHGRWDFAHGPLGGFGVIATPGWLVRRDTLAAAGGFDERLRSWDDWELGVRIAQVAGIGFLDEPLFIQDRVQGGHMWRNRSVYASDMAVILSKHPELWRGKPKLLARQYFIQGRAEAAFNSPEAARRALMRAIRLDPAAWRAWLALAGTFAGREGFRTLEQRWQAFTSWRDA